MSLQETVLRRAVILVACLNLLYFAVEFTMARRIGSAALFADSVDFLEDASVNLLIALALGWSAMARARLGLALAAILAAPALGFLWVVWQKFGDPVPPEPVALTVTGLGALLVNLGCAVVLAKFRDHANSLTRAAFLSARNDAIANIAIMAAGLVTAATASVWPDLLAGFGIAAMNLDAARDVWAAAHREHRAAA